ncbi:RiPP maturation radical SAM C-methyltransferase [Streptomyces sp. 1222.5]|uniref:RiPP maturation radical SAM C-methyltransferase n=1 Tax=Streptomyces sp. 1222.5 TaxID=1881026 RepID=UPI003EBC6C57
MPWHALEYPSLPIGILQEACRRAGRALPTAHFENLAWADFLFARSGGEITPVDFQKVADSPLGVGDWVFAGVLQGDESFCKAEAIPFIEEAGLSVRKVMQMRECAAEYIDRTAEDIAAQSPDLIGFTSTFMQNVPSLALAKKLKGLLPESVIVMGGANCDGDMGVALHRCFPFVDFVVRGEGDEVFLQILDAIEQGYGFEEIDGLCWRSGNAASINAMTSKIIPPGRIPSPVYDDWFETFKKSPAQAYLDPKLLVETSRGCWWGDGHQCTFCGLNGSLIQFRSKTPSQVLEEISNLVSKHRVLDLYIVDNIIDNTYFSTLLPRISELGWDLRIHYEVKSNLRPDNIVALRDAGVVGIQPGIESLSSPILREMDKGVTALQNVRTLRDSESAGLTVFWNWLVGFPGELPKHYETVLDQIPSLFHLQPSGPGPNRIYLERFSPYFDNPSMGFPDRRPKSVYQILYDLPEKDLGDLAYFFDTDPVGIDEKMMGRLSTVINQWISAYPHSSLTRTYMEDAVHITDRRTNREPKDHLIQEPSLIAAYIELEHGRSLKGVRRRLVEKGYDVDQAKLEDWVAGLVRERLLFQDEDRYLALATASNPQRIEKVLRRKSHDPHWHSSP